MGCICAPVLLFGTIFLSGRCKPRASWRGKGSYSSVLSLDGFWCVVVWTFPDCKIARIPADCSKILNTRVKQMQFFPVILHGLDQHGRWFLERFNSDFCMTKTWGNGSWMSILLIGHCEMSLMTCLVWWILLQNQAELGSWRVILYTEKGVGNITFVKTPQTQFWGGLVRICGMLWSQWCLLGSSWFIMIHQIAEACTEVWSSGISNGLKSFFVRVLLFMVLLAALWY